jgi:hypothetical protein
VGLQLRKAAVDVLVMGGEAALQPREATLPVRLAIVKTLGEAVELVDDDLQVGVHDAACALPTGVVRVVGNGNLQGSTNSGTEYDEKRWTANSEWRTAWIEEV